MRKRESKRQRVRERACERYGERERERERERDVRNLIASCVLFAFGHETSTESDASLCVSCEQSGKCEMLSGLAWDE